jgi:DNA repair protein RecN (Recombination protein N)
MLTSLSIRNVVLIESLVIEFRSGLCALTGETGAGKSILLDALGLALGGRSDSGFVRKGSDKAIVTAEFSLPEGHPAIKLIREQELETDNTLVLRRVINSDGRSRAFINDQPVSVGLIRSVGGTLAEIHGQFETQGLLNSSSHLPLLDDYAGIEHDLPRLRDNWQSAKSELEKARLDAEKARADEEYLRQALEDLDELSPQTGEEEQLNSLRNRLMRREQIIAGLNEAHSFLSQAESQVASAARSLERTGDEAASVNSLTESAAIEIAEAIAGIEALSTDIEESEHDLQSIDDRLFALKAQARKHDCAIDDLPEKREEIGSKLNLIERTDDVIAELERKVEQARSDYLAEAEEVSKERRKAAEKLDKLVGAELPPLKLDKARFVTRIEQKEESEWGPQGLDRVRFLVSTNPGADPGPLDKIASGGEMARFMLALKVIMAETGTAQTLIFDEVDSGIGGSTADAVGERLSRLAASKQILVVTHSPQVAARASHHWIVLKGVDDQQTAVSAMHLEENPHRREEIARMLAGAEITEEARAAAERLLEAG